MPTPSTASRDAILQRIRSTLAEKPTEGVPVSPPPPPDVWPLENPSPEAMAQRFTQELQAVFGEVIPCATMDDARGKLVELMTSAGWPYVAALDRPLCRELLAGFNTDQVVWSKPEWTAPDMAELPVSVLAPEVLLADTGSAVIAPRATHERILCYLPPACVIVATLGQLAEHLPAAWPRISAGTADPQTRGEFVFVTGPSRTADIEKILKIGRAHF